MTKEQVVEELNMLRRTVKEDSTADRALCCAIEAIQKSEQQTGEWIPHESKYGGNSEPVYTCSKCGDNIGFKKKNFCSNCGIKMKGMTR